MLRTFLLLLLLISFSDTDGNYKAFYLQKMTDLYNNLGAPNGVEVARHQVMLGLISDALNDKSTNPREEVVVKDLQIFDWAEAEGEFKARILTDSLQSSLQYSLVQGTVNYTTFQTHVTSLQKLDIRLYSSETHDLHSSFNNGSEGIRELLSLADAVNCKKNVLDECVRGSVTMDTWANETLYFQRMLQSNLTLDLIQTMGTHNSFNNKADGYGTGDFTLGVVLEILSGGKWEFVWAQQWFTMTDQLKMGVRHLMLDPVFFWGKMRLCHCGTTFKWFDDVLHFIEKTLNTTFQFDSKDLGCMPHDRTLVAGLQEIQDWLTVQENTQEFVMVHINDESHSADWGHVQLIQDPVTEIFSDLLFTPEDKQTLFPDRWPTPNELVKLGKKVVVTCTNRCNDSHIFLDMHIPTWDRDTTKYFTVAPTCGGFSPGQFYLVGGESQVIGPLYNGPKKEGLIIPQNFPYLIECPVTVSEMDLVSPALISAAIWSWSRPYSYNNVTTNDCAAVDAKKGGRWVVLPCYHQLPHMCQNSKNISDIRLSNTVSDWGNAQCPTGYTFALPQTGYVNWRLYTLARSKNTTQLWINLPPSKKKTNPS